MTQEITDTSKKANLLINVMKGDITKQKFEAIVTVIAPDLEIRGGLNTTIFSHSGLNLDDYILENIIEPREGDVFAAPAFDLPSKYIIFGVIPTWRSDLDIIDKHLVNAVRGAIDLARKMNVSDLAIPLICCGRKGYPLNRGIRLILQAVSDRIGGSIQKITFICDNDEAVAIYQNRLGI